MGTRDVAEQLESAREYAEGLETENRRLEADNARLEREANAAKAKLEEVIRLCRFPWDGQTTALDVLVRALRIVEGTDG